METNQLRDGRDYLSLKSGESIPVNSASSRQQEAIWILLYLISLELSWKAAFTVVEEPEAHLFPDAQRTLMHALTMAANRLGNQLMITTHSPYILTPLNNLLLAHQLGRKNESEIPGTVDRDLWIDPERFECYFVENGSIRSVMDQNAKMMDLDDLDKTSDDINAQFDALSKYER